MFEDLLAVAVPRSIGDVRKPARGCAPFFFGMDQDYVLSQIFDSLSLLLSALIMSREGIRSGEEQLSKRAAAGASGGGTTWSALG